MIKPLPGYLLIKPIEDDEKTASGLYNPETSKDKPSKGKVIAFGDYTKDWREQWGEMYQWPKSKLVVYKKWTNQEVEYEGETYLLVPFNELLAVIE